jgi:16S rRNA (cytidine1402-2'-O)-methyltransferase
MNDITYRAIDVLKKVSLILSEDTRESDKILNHFQLTTPQISYRDQNHNQVIARIIDDLKNGYDIALVSDSGTPLISDPGYKLVREVKEAGINVVPIPGPSAVISALSASGLPTDRFIFLGFLPKGPGQRKTMLKKYGNLDSTLTIYESPFRLSKLLAEIHETLGDRTVTIARELTKVHEEILTLKASEALKLKTFRGEYVVLVAKEGI